jgi:protease I
MPQELEKKKVAMIIAFRDFRDEEYFIPRKTLESAGVQIITVSTSSGKAIGKLGGEAEVDALLEDIEVATYDAILFIGGSGAHKYIDNEVCHRIAREAVENNKILGAICIAPAILAKAGILEGKKATVWSSVMDKSAVKILKELGATYLPDPVVTDGKIVTASGPIAAKKFAQEIIEILR